jgi:putative ABC transport system ATP-binding protein
MSRSAASLYEELSRLLSADFSHRNGGSLYAFERVRHLEVKLAQTLLPPGSPHNSDLIDSLRIEHCAQTSELATSIERAIDAKITEAFQTLRRSKSSRNNWQHFYAYLGTRLTCAAFESIAERRRTDFLTQYLGINYGNWSPLALTDIEMVRQSNDSWHAALSNEILMLHEQRQLLLRMYIAQRMCESSSGSTHQKKIYNDSTLRGIISLAQLASTTNSPESIPVGSFDRAQKTNDGYAEIMVAALLNDSMTAAELPDYFNSILSLDLSTLDVLLGRRSAFYFSQIQYSSSANPRDRVLDLPTPLSDTDQRLFSFIIGYPVENSLPNGFGTETRERNDTDERSADRFVHVQTDGFGWRQKLALYPFSAFRGSVKLTLQDPENRRRLRKAQIWSLLLAIPAFLIPAGTGMAYRIYESLLGQAASSADLSLTIMGLAIIAPKVIERLPLVISDKYWMSLILRITHRVRKHALSEIYADRKAPAAELDRVSLDIESPHLDTLRLGLSCAGRIFHRTAEMVGTAIFLFAISPISAIPVIAIGAIQFAFHKRQIDTFRQAISEANERRIDIAELQAEDSGPDGVATVTFDEFEDVNTEDRMAAGDAYTKSRNKTWLAQLRLENTAKLMPYLAAACALVLSHFTKVPLVETAAGTGATALLLTSGGALADDIRALSEAQESSEIIDRAIDSAPKRHTGGQKIGAEKGLDVRYFVAEDGRTSATEPFTLDIYSGQRVAIIGKSGAGKTSLLINSLTKRAALKSGVIELRGRNDRSMDWISHLDIDPRQFKSIVGVVRKHQRLPKSYMRKLEQTGATDLARSYMSALDLTPQFISDVLTGDMSPNASSGERERVTIAVLSALKHRAKFMVFDEPGADLDPPTRRALRDFLFGPAMHEKTVVLLSHEASLASTADVVAFMGENGGLTMVGTPREVLRDWRRPLAANQDGVDWFRASQPADELRRPPNENSQPNFV